MSYTKKQRNEIYKKLLNMLLKNGIIYNREYMKVAKDFSYSLYQHSKLNELSLFEPDEPIHINMVAEIQLNAILFCIAMTEN